MKINHEETKDTKEVEDRGSKIEDRGESIFDPRSPILDRLHGWFPTGVEIRRRSQVVRRRSAKPLYAGSIPAAASKITRGKKVRDTRVHIMVYGAVWRRQNHTH